MKLTLHTQSGYDPMAHGALCDRCLLRGRPMVPPECKPSDALVIGDGPSKVDVEQGRLFCGNAGRELYQAVTPYAPRHELAVTNAVLCRPDKGDYAAVVRMTKKLRRSGPKYAALLEPTQACLPRLRQELTQYVNLIPLGALAVEAVYGGGTKVMRVRGRPCVTGKYKAVASLHPALLQKQSRWRHIFRGDIARAFRLFSGALEWRMPAVSLSPAPEALERWLKRAAVAGTPVVVDIETDGIEALTCNLRCIGLARLRADGTVHQTAVVGWQAINHQDEFYTESDKQRIRTILRRFLVDKRILKVGHNFGYFDAAVLDRVFNCVTAPYADTIILHRAVESELPHSLGFLGSAYTDVQAWKDVRNALDYEDNDELHRYCATDVAVTGVVYGPLEQGVELREQEQVVAMDMRVQKFCRDMHQVGMFIDMAELTRWQDVLTEQRAHELYILQEGVKRIWGRAGFNPGSTIQVADLIFGETGWGVFCKREWLTEGGEPSTDGETLRHLLRQPGMSKSQINFLTHLRRYRRAVKFLGTFVAPIVETLSGLPRGAPPRIHPQWNAHVTVSGRLSSSRPNAQQVPFKMRSMFTAAPGNVLVAADMDQIELRFAAAVAGADRYLKVFRDGGDPHAVTSAQIYGQAWAAVARGANAAQVAQKKKLRDFAKRFSYACLYGAEDKTVHEVLTSVEDKNGDFPYLGLSVDQTSSQRRRWLDGNPEFRAWWSTTVACWRRDTFLKDVVIGRRRDFLDGENKNEQVNFPVQSGSAAIVHLNTFALLDAGVAPGFDGPGTGVIQQGHDAIMIECSAARGAEVQKLLQRCMCRTVPALPQVSFTATAKRGHRWTELS